MRYPHHHKRYVMVEGIGTVCNAHTVLSSLNGNLFDRAENVSQMLENYFNGKETGS